MIERPLRIMVAKAGLDGHDRGARVVVRALEEAGFDVVYSGLHRTPAEVVEEALRQGVDAVGLSILSGAHMALLPEVIEGLRGEGAPDVIVFAGGIIPQEDVPRLRALGVAEVFLPGTPTEQAIAWIRANVRARAATAPGAEPAAAPAASPRPGTRTTA
jgi:methylmalonyl-CoA mutase C-terminal domain/subunit